MTYRIASIALALVAFATGANAATLSVFADKPIYFLGETVTLTVIGDDEGATSYGVLGILHYDGARVDNGTRTQTTLIGQNGPWVTGTLPAQDNGVTASSTAFNQIVGLSGGTFEPDTALNLPGTLAIVTLTAQVIGVVPVSWGSDLDFFGLVTAPGTSFTIVPEPATASLIGLGLLSLAVAKRRTR